MRFFVGIIFTIHRDLKVGAVLLGENALPNKLCIKIVCVFHTTFNQGVENAYDFI